MICTSPALNLHIAVLGYWKYFCEKQTFSSKFCRLWKKSLYYVKITKVNSISPSNGLFFKSIFNRRYKCKYITMHRLKIQYMHVFKQQIACWFAWWFKHAGMKESVHEQCRKIWPTWTGYVNNAIFSAMIATFTSIAWIIFFWTFLNLSM